MALLHVSSRRFRLRALAAAALLAGGLACQPQAQAQETLHFNQTLQISEVGDGIFTIHMKFNAQQWQNWQQRYGMNPALFRRDMIRTLSQYSVSDFKLDRNEMEREVTVTLHAHGVTRYRGNGLFEAEIPKVWRLVNQQGSELKFSHLEPMGNGGNIHHHIVANFPARATAVSSPQPGEAGMNHVTYRVPVATASSLPLWSGIGLVGSGLVIAGISLAMLGGSLLLGARKRPGL